MSKALGCAALFFGLTLVGPLAVSRAAAPTSAPASMMSCTVIPATISRRGTSPEAIRVSFMIASPTAADLARFTATAPAGAYQAFTARGVFTKGVVIADRVLQADPSAPVRPLSRGVECMLTYVHFVDGSSWSAP
jgi:hypothetical protein